LRFTTQQEKKMTITVSVVDAPVISNTPTPYRLLCSTLVGEEGCGKATFITTETYDAAMRRPDSRWMCPVCGNVAWFDDDNYEAQVFPDPNE